MRHWNKGDTMKDLIERYIYAVVRRLPEASQEEIKEELKANIYDMLPGNPTEEHITKVLYDLGSPRDLAVKYQAKERYLVSPRYYDDYIHALKIVSMIFVLISMVSGLIEGILAPVETEIFEHIVSIIASTFAEAFQGLFGAFAIVTLVFWGIEQAQLKTSRCEWKVSDLPELPKQNALKISRTETIFEIVFETVFSVIFIMILSHYHTWIGYYSEANVFTPFFNPDVLGTFVLLFIVSLLSALCLSVLKLIKGRWSSNLAIFSTLYDLFSFGLLIFFLTQSNFVHPDFFQAISLDSGLSVAEIASGYETAIRVIIIIVTITTILSISTLWYKIIKAKHKGR
jgi:hypothetical protein